jgi:hypothetical protein
MGADSLNWDAGTLKRFDRTMKTQLLQDLNESGSANARPLTPEPKGLPDTAPDRDATVRPEVPAAEAATPAGSADTPAAEPVLTPAAQPAVAPAEAPAVAPAASPLRPGPAVWQRPRPVPADAPAPALVAAAPAPAPEPVRKIQARPAATHLTIQPKGFAPQPLPFGATVPNHDGMNTTDRDPDWLAERLARDAALHERPEWNGSWVRRLASWGAAGVLLALVAAGGLWLYEQRQVEGALAVLANMNPPPAAGVTQPDTRPVTQAVAPGALPTLPADTGLRPTATPPARASAAAPAAAPLAQDVPAPVAPTEAVGQSATASTAAGAGYTANGATVEAPIVKAVDTAAEAKRADAASSSRSKTRSERSARVSDEQAGSSPPKRKHAATRKQTKTVASAAGREGTHEAARTGERSYRQRYEETLMQCRAHGYDERQCLQRGCEMTRFGFACKG